MRKFPLRRVKLKKRRKTKFVRNAILSLYEILFVFDDVLPILKIDSKINI